MGLVVILACQLVGELIARSLEIPIPGAVIGMVLFLAVLVLRDRYQQRHQPAGTKPATPARPPQGRSRFTASGELLLTHLQLFFVPAGVGIMAATAHLKAEAIPIVVGLWGSWLIGLIAVGALVQLLRRGNQEQP